MLKHSFSFDGVDMRERYGIVVERFVDRLAPARRDTRLVIPKRNGSVDFGGFYYEDRELEIRCGTIKLLSRSEARELSYTLAAKGRIVRWDEPDKYYIGQIFDPAELEESVQSLKRFTLRFSCEPFAYGEQTTQAFTNSKNFAYNGTAVTPTIITITNNNDYEINNIEITMREALA